MYEQKYPSQNKNNKSIGHKDVNSEIDKIIQLSKQPPPMPREWIVDKLIPKNCLTTIYASGGIGKSYLAIALGINACIGNQTFIGKNFYSHPLNTLFLDYELDKDEIMRRSIELFKGMGSEGIPDNFYYQAPDPSISKYISKLPSIIFSYNIELLIIDSMGASGVDAMDEKAVISIYSALSKLGITSILIDHQSKTQSQDGHNSKSPFGSVYKSNMSRSEIHLTSEKNTTDNSTIKVIHTKSNFGAKCEEFLVDFKFASDCVSIEISASLTEKEQYLFDIRAYMLDKKSEGIKLNQTNLIEHFQGNIGKDKLINLLDMGHGKYWNTEKGQKNSTIYDPIEDS